MPHTHIILANMDTFATHGERHINTVIDEQWHLVALCQLVKTSGCLDQGTSIAGFFTQLDASDATSQRLLDDREEVGFPKDLGPRVGHEVERIVNIFLFHFDLGYVEGLENFETALLVDDPPILGRAGCGCWMDRKC